MPNRSWITSWAEAGCQTEAGSHHGQELDAKQKLDHVTGWGLMLGKSWALPEPGAG